MFSMIEHKGTFYAGAFIFLIPFLGFPTMWKMVLVGIAGFVLVVVSLRVPNPRKVVKDKIKKESFSSVDLVSEVIPEIKKENTIVSNVDVPVVASISPKIEIIVPKKRKVSTKSTVSRKLNIQE